MRNRVSVKTGITLLAVLFVNAAIAAEPAKEETGKELAYNNKQGNCLACHAMPTMADAAQAGNSGPPLVAMSARFPSKAALRAQIWDPTVRNPDTFMPPIGKHHILTEQQLDKVVDFIYGL
jgi:sulfur-oxidizing protein SoxX